MHSAEFMKFLYHFIIISEINFILKRFSKEVVFTEIFQKIVIQKFRKLFSVQCGKILKVTVSQKFRQTRQINFLVFSLAQYRKVV